MVKSQWEVQGSDKSWFSFRHNDAFRFVSKCQFWNDNWTLCNLKTIREMAYRQPMTLKTIYGWRDIKHVSLHFISLQKKAHFSFPALQRWFELAWPSPKRMHYNDANLGVFWQDLDTWYVGQLPIPCWFYQSINIGPTGTGGKRKKRKTEKRQIGFNRLTLLCHSVTDLQPHLLLCHTIGAEDAQRHRCLRRASVC